MKRYTRRDWPARVPGKTMDCQCWSGRPTWGDLVVYDNRYGERRLLINGAVEELVEVGESIGDNQWIRVSDGDDALSLVLKFAVSLHEQLIASGVLDKPDPIRYSLPGNGHHPRCSYYAEDSFIDD